MDVGDSIAQQAAAVSDSMDVDMDIDLAEDPEIARLEAEAMNIEARSAAAAIAHANGTNNPEDDKSRPAPTKIHVRGVDNLTTKHIRDFAFEHYSADCFQRVEWIDDTSANLIYETIDAAAEALNALSETLSDQPSPLQLRKAKIMSSHPDTELYVRQATVGDVKAPRAHERSRFYLMNPEHDPRERRNRYDDRPRRGSGRRDDARRREEPKQAFDVSMYDDDAGEQEPGQEERGGSYDSYESGEARSRRPARLNNNKDLFANKSKGGLRDRSASPVRDGDGRFGFDEDQPRRRTARRRSLTPPPRRRDLNAQAQQSNAVKELFPDKGRESGLNTPLTNAKAGVELFPNHNSPSKRNRELFPNKTPTSNHRRSDALDGVETARARLTLADRISNPPKPELFPNKQLPPIGFSIKGVADSSEGAPGFSIRGASREINPIVKELFPSKMEAGGNNGKELFADKMKGRNQQRRRAEDLF
ncbi:hypothetical protein MBLNU459_g6081t1 [Dothideomycetes sp. NU459]